MIKMSILMNINNELQHIIEAMNAVTNVDITIVDEKLQRIASTVDKEYGIGAKAPIYFWKIQKIAPYALNVKI